MARTFNGSTQYLRGAAPLNACPITLSALVSCTDTSNVQAVVALGKDASVAGADYYRVALAGNAAGDPVRAQFTNSSGVSYNKDTGTGYTSGVWFQCSAHFSLASGNVTPNPWIDGVNTAGSAGVGAPGSITVASIARLEAGATFPGIQYLTGSVAEAACWNVVLVAQEQIALASKFCPLLVRPANLKAYWALGGRQPDDDKDRVGGYNLAPAGSPTVTTHPRVIYPCEAQYC